MAATTAAVVGGAAIAKYSSNKQESAAKKAAKAQQGATDASIAYTEEATAPFRAFGESAIPGAQTFIDDPTGASFLQGNPMFDAAIDYTGGQIKNQQALAGKLNSGGTIDQLFKNYLSVGDSFVNSGFNRAFAPVQFGGNVSTNNATNISSLLTNNANAQGASAIAQGNAQAGFANNLLSIGAMAFSDERLKTDIKPVGKDAEGLNLYEYSYKSPEKFIGYMAQEVEEKHPENVLLHPSGYKMVTERFKPKRIA